LRRINFDNQPISLPKLYGLMSLELLRPLRRVLIGRAFDEMGDFVDLTQLIQKINSVVVHRLPSGLRREQTRY
jgi:hypothetical protein